MYYWICQKCDLKVWGAENCWCGNNREQNSALAEQKTKAKKGTNNMEHLARIEDILISLRSQKRGAEFKKTVEMLCQKGIPNGVFQDYNLLMAVLEILSVCETIIDGGK